MGLGVANHIRIKMSGPSTVGARAARELRTTRRSADDAHLDITAKCSTMRVVLQNAVELRTRHRGTS